jgi:anti-anti-sigma factor
MSFAIYLHNGIPILRCEGVLQAENALPSREQWCQLIEQHHGRLVLDWSKIHDIDAKILGLFVFLQQNAQKIHGELRLLHPSPEAVRCLERIRLQHTFAFYDDADVATRYE